MEPPPGTAENSKLRHVEKDVLIPQIMRERAKERCSGQVQDCGIPQGGRYLKAKVYTVYEMCCAEQGKHIDCDSAFTKCCQETGFLMVVKCRKENTALKNCLVGYYSDPLFYEQCKTEYLKQREEYRATGIKKKRPKHTSNV